eukprot:SAG25_NODE_2433_length_1610_cov_3.786234_4_plen_140_part_00
MRILSLPGRKIWKCAGQQRQAASEQARALASEKARMIELLAREPAPAPPPPIPELTLGQQLFMSRHSEEIARRQRCATMDACVRAGSLCDTLVLGCHRVPSGRQFCYAKLTPCGRNNYLYWGFTTGGNSGSNLPSLLAP